MLTSEQIEKVALKLLDEIITKVDLSKEELVIKNSSNPLEECKKYLKEIEVRNSIFYHKFSHKGDIFDFSSIENY